MSKDDIMRSVPRVLENRSSFEVPNMWIDPALGILSGGDGFYEKEIEDNNRIGEYQLINHPIRLTPTEKKIWPLICRCCVLLKSEMCDSIVKSIAKTQELNSCLSEARTSSTCNGSTLHEQTEIKMWPKLWTKEKHYPTTPAPLSSFLRPTWEDLPIIEDKSKQFFLPFETKSRNVSCLELRTRSEL